VLGVAADVDKLAKDVAALEFRRMFSIRSTRTTASSTSSRARADGSAGLGLDARAHVLKYCDRKGFTAEVLEHTPGEVGRIKSATSR